MKNIPAAFFHDNEGLGKPSALHSSLASLPRAKALSAGSTIHLGGTVGCSQKKEYINFAEITPKKSSLKAI